MFILVVPVSTLAQALEGGGPQAASASAPRIWTTFVWSFGMGSIWRRLAASEGFDHDHRPFAGNRRGYLATSEIFLAGHENCGCYRSSHAEQVHWFLPHSDAEHGRYPLHIARQGIVLLQLREQMPHMRPGFIVKLDAYLSYGELRT